MSRVAANTNDLLALDRDGDAARRRTDAAIGDDLMCHAANLPGASGPERRDHLDLCCAWTYISIHYYTAHVHAFDVLGVPARRRILELLADGELAAGAIGETIQAEFQISQPAVSQHLAVLRTSGFLSVRPDGARRLYAVRGDGLRDVDRWLDRFRTFWTPPLDALETELARGQRQRRLRARPAAAPTSRSTR